MKNNKRKFVVYVAVPVAARLMLASTASAATITQNNNQRNHKSTQHEKHSVRDYSTLANILGMNAVDVQTAIENGKNIDTLISEKGLDKNTVIQTLRAEHEAQMESKIQEDISSGKITQEKADRMKANKEQRKLVHKTALATALGISVDTLNAEIKSGKTIDQLATERGITKSELNQKISAKKTVYGAGHDFAKKHMKKKSQK